MTVSTRAALLQEAEHLLRTRGYAAFSYADLAAKVAIRKASIHHHFPTKEDLGLAIIDEYLEGFAASLARIAAQDGNVPEKLRCYAQFFVDALEARNLPLCGALAAESLAMPDSMRARTRNFFELHLEWLTGIMEAGVAEGSFRADIRPREAAALLLSAMEGASLVAWVLNEKISLESIFETALKSFS